MPTSQTRVGLGDPSSVLNVYIDKRPAFQELASLNTCKPLVEGEIKAIGSACGNGWRKVFNIYAKLVFALASPSDSNSPQTSVFTPILPVQQISCWQEYRDKQLLCENSGTALLFCKPIIAATDKLHIVMGRSYALSLTLPNSLIWLDREFAIDHTNRLIVCPYFDYRQLSNIKIIRLVELIQDLLLDEQTCLVTYFS